MSVKDCPFCIENGLLRGTVLYEDDLWYYQRYDDGELKGGGMAITKRHVVTPFEINEAEWLALHKLLPKFKSFVDQHNPDGYNLGWNILPPAGQNTMGVTNPVNKEKEWVQSAAIVEVPKEYVKNEQIFLVLVHGSAEQDKNASTRLSYNEFQGIVKSLTITK